MKEYEVEINGITHVLLLDEEDAKRYTQATAVVVVKAPVVKKATGAAAKG